MGRAYGDPHDLQMLRTIIMVDSVPKADIANRGKIITLRGNLLVA